MRQSASGNNLVRITVTIGDFVVLNVILLALIELAPQVIPSFFHSAIKTLILSANFSMLVAQYFFHTIIHYRLVTFEEVVERIFKLTATLTLVMAVSLKQLDGVGNIYYFLLAFFPAFFLMLMLVRLGERILLKHYRQMGRNIRYVVFVGHDPALVSLYTEVMQNPSTGYRVSGYYSNGDIANAPEGLVRLGDILELNRRMEKNKDGSDTHDMFCCLSHDYNEEIIRIMRYCDKNMIRFYYVPRMFGNFRLKLKAERFGDIEMFTNYREPLAEPENAFIKRFFDVLVSLLACLVVVPLCPIIALIIKLQSPGPVFFKQQRTGLNGKTFNCLKFRSMHVNVDADKMQATKNDPRKFAFGNFMRKTNIDELPQVFNVLRGDMSIVGPRPHMLYHTDIYSGLIDKYMVRHFCKPGITGWAQITGFRGETKELWQMEERIKRDIWYIEHWTFWLDIKIILKTAIGLIIPDKQAY